MVGSARAGQCPDVPDHAAALRLAESQHAVVSRSQLRQCGWSNKSIERLEASRDWEAVSTAVFRRAGSSVTTEQQLCAAILDSGGDSVLSHFSAARVWGLQGCSLRPVHVCRTTQSRRHCELAVVHRVRRLPARWVTSIGGIGIVSPELLAVQLFAVCRSEQRAERMVDRLWALRLLSGQSLAGCLNDLGASGRNGIAGLRRYLDVRGPSYTPPASGLESRVAVLLADAGITVRPQVNVGGARWTGRVDFIHDSAPLVIEVQSATYHAALSSQRDDERRIATLRRDGFEVVEVWDDEVWTRPAEFIARVRRVLDALCCESGQNASLSQHETGGGGGSAVKGVGR